MQVIKLALNAGSLLLPHTGIASYTRNLAMALRERSDVDLSLFYGVSWSREIRNAGAPAVNRFREALLKFIPRPRGFLRKLGVQRRCFLRGIRDHAFDIYHEPSFLPFPFPGPTVITIHDLSTFRHPETQPADRVQIIKEQLPLAIEQATNIMVDSHFIAREVIEAFHVDPARVHAIHLGVSSEFHPRPLSEIQENISPFGLTCGSYIFAVGTLEPRKNLTQAIKAYADLPENVRRTMPLVIAGMRGWLSGQLEAQIRQFEERGEVRWLGYVPASTLPILYSGARFLVYPSLYEGFGLPLLEAMASGIPVITSNRASLPEVAGDVGIMIDPEDIDGMRTCMLRLIEDNDEAKYRGELGIERARQFTWEACAMKTLAVYRKALGIGP